MMRFVAMSLGVCVVTADAQPRMLNVGDATIRYDVNGTGHPIVFIHGWAQNLEIWDEQVAAFSPRYRVIRFDRRGFGQSTGNADVSADADDVRILLDSLGIRTAHLVGLSAGARVALRFAAAFPDRVGGLVLYGAPPGPDFPGDPPGRGQQQLMPAIMRQHGIDSVRKAILAAPIAWIPPGRPELVARLQASLAQYTGRDLLNPQPQSGRVPEVRWDQTQNVRAATLIVHGDHEVPRNIAFADSMLRRMPNARRVVIKDGGHGAHFAQPEQFNAALWQFFTSLPQ
jgi:3-oxoadipate enol-lactonase